ncbi:hypothetical protein ACVWXN_008882 [Bradyrhizobium sp. i1.4.4]
MSEQVTNLVQNYIAVWNERDAGKRRLLIDRVFSDACVYIDPNDSVAGKDAIERLVQALQARLPDLRFTLAGHVNAHHDQILFGWTLAAPGAQQHLPPQASTWRCWTVTAFGSFMDL